MKPFVFNYCSELFIFLLIVFLFPVLFNIFDDPIFSHFKFKI